jgi:hypothetical protein
MIKVEVFRKEGKGTTTMVFQSRDVSQEGLDKFDELYSALLGSRPRRGGYLDSNKFEIEVKDED